MLLQYTKIFSFLYIRKLVSPSMLLLVLFKFSTTILILNFNIKHDVTTDGAHSKQMSGIVFCTLKCLPTSHLPVLNVHVVTILLPNVITTVIMPSPVNFLSTSTKTWMEMWLKMTKYSYLEVLGSFCFHFIVCTAFHPIAYNSNVRPSAASVFSGLLRCVPSSFLTPSSWNSVQRFLIEHKDLKIKITREIVPNPYCLNEYFLVLRWKVKGM